MVVPGAMDVMNRTEPVAMNATMIVAKMTAVMSVVATNVAMIAQPIEKTVDTKIARTLEIPIEEHMSAEIVTSTMAENAMEGVTIGTGTALVAMLVAMNVIDMTVKQIAALPETVKDRPVDPAMGSQPQGPRLARLMEVRILSHPHEETLLTRAGTDQSTR